MAHCHGSTPGSTELFLRVAWALTVPRRAQSVLKTQARELTVAMAPLWGLGGTEQSSRCVVALSYTSTEHNEVQAIEAS